MELLKAKLYQETAVYRIPFSLEIVESYPLPTPCTVNGMIHSLLGADSLIPGLSFSIQGSHNGIMEDYQWYKKIAPAAGGTYSETKRPMVVNVLNGVTLTVHIASKDRSLLDKILKVLDCPPYYPFLGRAEDLVEIVSAGFVQVNDPEIEEEYGQPAFVPKQMADSLGISGTLQRLPLTYSYIGVPQEGKKKASPSVIREFEWGDYFYIERPNIEEARIDEEGDPVWLEL
ncbi:MULTISPECIES: CRISPR-associated protein Cas5 [Mesotoga]|uniref:CRISPR-associated protein Cas5 n=1 Tax=Mesotoga TaxID=1184396 RepID=UPI002C975FFC|nr:CRISPR-associated protein Cas5 [Mesotoga sp.]HRX66131.1 CRISPR-associated protein Cas5 [Mesotoga sp.]